MSAALLSRTQFITNPYCNSPADTLSAAEECWRRLADLRQRSSHWEHGKSSTTHNSYPLSRRDEATARLKKLMNGSVSPTLPPCLRDCGAQINRLRDLSELASTLIGSSSFVPSDQSRQGIKRQKRCAVDGDADIALLRIRLTHRQERP